MKNKFSIVVTSFFIVLSFCDLAVAGGPLATVSGVGVRYNTASAISFKTDLGTMGNFTNAIGTNLAISSFQVWQNVATANITFSNGGQLPVDVNSTNYLTYLSNSSDGINPIIFDNDGSIVDALFGEGSSSKVIGFAGSSYFTAGANAGFFSEGRAVMNGLFAGGTKFTEAQYKATFIHEFGHFIGLDHSQINYQFAGDGIKVNDSNIPTMFPTSTDEDTCLSSLNPDDISAVSQLYPKAAFASNTGKISGSVVRFDNSVVRGANVIAISTGEDSLFNQISTVTDYYKANNGNYTIIGLTPGNYYVKIEPIRNNFTEGSSVGPYAGFATDLSFVNPVTKEFYNGVSESSDPVADLPSLRTAVPVSAGNTTSNINLIANKEPNVPITSILEYHGALAYVVKLPSRNNEKRYAVRFTPGANATLVRTEFRLNGAATAIVGTGSLKVSVHQNMTGSLGGIPGTQIGSSVTVPFTQLTIGVYNTISFSPQNIALFANVNYHLAFEVVGIAGDTIQLVVDDGVTNETNRSSSYINSEWFNFIDANTYGTGYNLAIRTVINIPTDVANGVTVLPDRFSLEQNYPNPFNPTTVIRYQIPAANYVSLKIFDAIGREMALLVNEEKERGSYEVSFDASNLSSGMYFARLQSGNQIQMKKMLLLK
ncbi:MAG: T9SS type A sorting domain-containing protein [Bacteroidota bacterium]|nr:T9SS type A sorting domain-containing protein [Bacteroidota bacterium]